VQAARGGASGPHTEDSLFIYPEISLQETLARPPKGTREWQGLITLPHPAAIRPWRRQAQLLPLAPPTRRCARAHDATDDALRVELPLTLFVTADLEVLAPCLSKLRAWSLQIAIQIPDIWL